MSVGTRIRSASATPSRLVRDGSGGAAADVALLKFCYIDIGASTDVHALFGIYRDTLAAVAAAHPHLAVVPCTAPLRHTESGLGVWVRERLGRRNRQKAANRARQAFNDLVRRAYAGTPIFDIAAGEATRPGGARDSFVLDGQRCDNLAAEYTSDGGHLNDTGARALAGAFVRAVADVLGRRPTGR
ncbi:MAG: hypothetical protein R2712_25760 [Vicinamibacterales bacterium]